MEKGRIHSVSGFSGGGTISDDQGRIIQYNSGSIISRERSGMKQGDDVWFERIGTISDVRAINIRKC